MAATQPALSFLELPNEVHTLSALRRALLTSPDPGSHSLGIRHALTSEDMHGFAPISPHNPAHHPFSPPFGCSGTRVQTDS